MSKKTIIQRALEYIYKHPNCLSADLAEHLEIKQNALSAYLGGPISAGLIVTCQVQRQTPTRGLQTFVQYRPGAAAPEECPDNWLDWQRAIRGDPPKPLKFNAAGPRDGTKTTSVRNTQAGSGDITPAAKTASSPSGNADLPSPGLAVVETPAACSQAADGIVAAISDPAVSDVSFAVTDDGELLISMEDDTFAALNRDQTRRLGRFLRNCSNLWY